MVMACQRRRSQSLSRDRIMFSIRMRCSSICIIASQSALQSASQPAGQSVGWTMGRSASQSVTRLVSLSEGKVRLQAGQPVGRGHLRLHGGGHLGGPACLRGGTLLLQRIFLQLQTGRRAGARRGFGHAGANRQAGRQAGT